MSKELSAEMRAQVFEVLTYFDFAEMCRSMQLLGHKWTRNIRPCGNTLAGENYQPSVDQIMDQARAMLEEIALADGDTEHSTGGLIARKMDGKLALFYCPVGFDLGD